MARGLGSEAMEYLRRGHYPAHSGELQLVVAPFSNSNYAPQSASLVKDDPRTSHASIWPYPERVPIVVHAPGYPPGRPDERGPRDARGSRSGGRDTHGLRLRGAGRLWSSATGIDSSRYFLALSSPNQTLLAFRQLGENLEPTR